MKDLLLLRLRPADPAAVLAAAATLCVGIVIGGAATFSLRNAAVVVVIFAALAAFLNLGSFGLALLLTGILPWLVVVSDLLPRLTETFAAGTAMLLVFIVVAPRGEATETAGLLRVGIACFFAPVLLSLARDGSSQQLIQATKYIVFPVMVLAVTEATDNRRLASLRNVALMSSIVAVAVNLVLGLAGHNITTHDRGSYHAGEVLGLSSEHELALLAGCVTATAIAAATWRWAWVAGVGAIATVATGVRSTLPGLAMLTLAKMVAGRARFRTIALVSVAVAAVFLSPAAHVVEARYHNAQSQGEFRSFSAFGSGRGGVYLAALAGWRSSSPVDWVIGTGLRTIPHFEEKRFGFYGRNLNGHSDVIEVGVQLGIIGLIGLVLIWWVLIRRARSKAPLVVLGSFALFNGALEYSAPLVIALLLSTAAGRALADSKESQERLLPSRSLKPIASLRRA